MQILASNKGAFLATGLYYLNMKYFTLAVQFHFGRMRRRRARGASPTLLRVENERQTVLPHFVNFSRDQVENH